ncbi:MAG: YopX family protein [Roseburia sp.]|nr:YopX family protein [Roseburia sp.]
MNRMVLYRGKRVDNGCWISGSLTKYTNIYADGEREDYYRISVMDIGFGHLRIDKDDIETYEPTYQQGYDEVVDYDTIGEYTNKDDIKGVWIFEGDIVTATLLHNQMEIVGKVVYNPVNAQFEIVTNKGTNLPMCRYGDIKVIGTIHDNPNLLTR